MAQVEAVLFAKLVGLNSRWFDFNGCVFSLRNMYRPDRAPPPDRSLARARAGRPLAPHLEPPRFAARITTAS
eukprot:204329-Prymnesium_polylepis.1